jgi:hypothetical protein
MKTKKDPYGVAFFEKLLVPELEKIWDKFKQHPDEEDEDNYFDYPEYCGLNKRVASKLPSEVVDTIQNLQHHIHSFGGTKEEFISSLRRDLFVLTKD